MDLPQRIDMDRFIDDDEDDQLDRDQQQGDEDDHLMRHDARQASASHGDADDLRPDPAKKIRYRHRCIQFSEAFEGRNRPPPP
ncbi:hypothetical protein AZKH_2952 [Azoarcus sp. KH32C]|nr:hypothetical protein AZKH_2952 [Azoarcus sp. KH32C]